MSAPIHPATEAAKAAQEIARATGKAIDAGREAGGFIAKFIAGPLEQGMGIFEDKLRYIRWERQLRFMKRSEEVLREVGLSQPTRAIPIKLAIPLIQDASMEEDNILQDRWVHLLVNAANEASGIELKRAYISIMEQITSLEAQILDRVYELPFEVIQHDGAVTENLPVVTRAAKDGETGLREPSDEVKLAIGNLDRVGCLKVGHSWGNGERFERVNPTILGRAFVQACRITKSNISSNQID